jgi:hypothetical protein
MLEVPPIFAAPRKYNTTRKRAEDDAEAKGLPAPHHTTQKREKGRSVSHSVQPEGSPPAGGHPPYDHTERKTYAESADGSDYGGNESRGYSPTTGNYELPGWFPTAESREASEAPDGGVLGLDGDGVIGSNDIQPQVRINPLQAATLPLAIAMGSKSLSRIVSKEEIPGSFHLQLPSTINFELIQLNVTQSKSDLSIQHSIDPYVYESHFTHFQRPSALLCRSPYYNSIRYRPSFSTRALRSTSCSRTRACHQTVHSETSRHAVGNGQWGGSGESVCTRSRSWIDGGRICRRGSRG